MVSSSLITLVISELIGNGLASKFKQLHELVGRPQLKVLHAADQTYFASHANLHFGQRAV